MDMSEQRAAKVAELRADAQNHRDRGAALDALAAVIRVGDIPVERWRVYWHAVADECRRQARGARQYADEVDGRAATIDTANEAHAEWTRTHHA